MSPDRLKGDFANRPDDYQHLLERLDSIAEENSQRFNEITVGRVSDFITYCHENPEKFKPWFLFNDLDDFILLHLTHDQWQGKTMHELELDKELDASNFVDRFRRWAKQTSKTEEERLGKIESIFPHEKYPATLEGWQALFEGHSEWRGKSISELIENPELNGSRFAIAFRKWTQDTSETEGERYKKVSSVFGNYINNRWTHLKTLDDWQNEYQDHPEWEGKSTTKMSKDKLTGGATFYRGFKRWVKSQTDDENEQARLTHSIFELKTNSWTHLTTVDDWVAEFNSHSEWLGRSTNQMRDIDGGEAFLKAFRIWCSHNSKSKYERGKLFQTIFELKTKSWKHLETIDDWVTEFNSNISWVGRTQAEMERDKDSGAHAFTRAFRRWLNKAVDNPTERIAYLSKIYVPYNKFTQEHWAETLPPSSDLAWIMGILCAGCEYSRKSLLLSSRNNEVVEKFKSFGEKVFELTAWQKQIKKARAVAFQSVTLLEYLGDLRKSSWVRTVRERHDWLYEKDEYIGQFLTGFFDLRGYCAPIESDARMITIRHSTKDGCNELKELLSRMGIENTAVVSHADRREGVQSIGIYSISDMHRLASIIHSCVPSKEACLEKYRNLDDLYLEQIQRKSARIEAYEKVIELHKVTGLGASKLVNHPELLEYRLAETTVYYWITGQSNPNNTTRKLDKPEDDEVNSSSS